MKRKTLAGQIREAPSLHEKWELATAGARPALVKATIAFLLEELTPDQTARYAGELLKSIESDDSRMLKRWMRSEEFQDVKAAALIKALKGIGQHGLAGELFESLQPPVLPGGKFRVMILSRRIQRSLELPPARRSESIRQLREAISFCGSDWRLWTLAKECDYPLSSGRPGRPAKEKSSTDKPKSAASKR